MQKQSPLNLIDLFGRRINYLRLSITDRCDFRCVYCMSEHMEFLPRDEVLSLEESARLVKIFASLGVAKREGTKAGKQFVAQPKSIREKTASLS